MTTDKTPATLADAKPGGCVQLGDSLTRFRCAGYDPTDGSGPIMVADPEGPWVLAADILSTSRNGNAAREEAETSSSKDDWFGDVLGSIGTVIPLGAALAAQPSTGGQGDVDMHALAASIGEVAHRLSTYMPHLSEWADRARDCGKAAEVLSALAARQPVGGQGVALLREVSAELESLDCGACIGSDAPMEDLHGRIAAHLAARQPVGEIPSEVLSAISGLAHIAKANVPSLADKHVAIIDAWLYATPTAQAVDLGPGLDAAAKLIQKKADDYAEEFGYDDMGVLSFGRGLHAEVKSDHHSFMLELVDELHALTDSQAVGK